jgi:hypothetical protein
MLSIPLTAVFAAAPKLSSCQISTAGAEENKMLGQPFQWNDAWKATTTWKRQKPGLGNDPSTIVSAYAS